MVRSLSVATVSASDGNGSTIIICTPRQGPACSCVDESQLCHHVVMDSMYGCTRCKSGLERPAGADTMPCSVASLLVWWQCCRSVGGYIRCICTPLDPAQAHLYSRVCVHGYNYWSTSCSATRKAEEPTNSLVGRLTKLTCWCRALRTLAAWLGCRTSTAFTPATRPTC